MPINGKGYDNGKKVTQVGGNTANAPKPPSHLGGNTSNTKTPPKQSNIGGNYAGPGHKMK